MATPTSGDRITVDIPSELIERTKKTLAPIEFEKTSDCIIYALEQFLVYSTIKEEKDVFTREEQNVVEKKLRDLGYT